MQPRGVLRSVLRARPQREHGHGVASPYSSGVTEVRAEMSVNSYVLGKSGAGGRPDGAKRKMMCLGSLRWPLSS